MIVLLTLLSCGHRAPAPPATGPLRGVMAALDADGDGRISRDEYETASSHAPDFATEDTDHDGALSETELTALVLASDPLRFEANLRPPTVAPSPPGTGGLSPEQQEVAEALRFEVAEIRARTPAAALPTSADIEAAAAAAPGTPLRTDLLARLRDAATKAGITLSPDL